MKEKSYVADINRSIYDIRDEEKDAYKLSAGLTPQIVEQLSKEKQDPQWMQLFRLRSLQIYNEMKVPDWGPSIEGLDMDNIVTYVRPNTKMKNGLMCQKTSRKPLSALAFPRQSRNPWQVLAPSTILSWFTTMSGQKWLPREWFTPIWKVP